jgi:hypothetical protein
MIPQEMDLVFWRGRFSGSSSLLHSEARGIVARNPTNGRDRFKTRYHLL